MSLRSNVVRFPHGAAAPQPNAPALGLECFVGGVFVGLVKTQGKILIAYRNDFTKIGEFLSMDLAVAAVCSAMALNLVEA